MKRWITVTEKNIDGIYSRIVNLRGCKCRRVLSEHRTMITLTETTKGYWSWCSMIRHVATFEAMGTVNFGELGLEIRLYDESTLKELRNKDTDSDILTAFTSCTQVGIYVGDRIFSTGSSISIKTRTGQQFDIAIYTDTTRTTTSDEKFYELKYNDLAQRITEDGFEILHKDAEEKMSVEYVDNCTGIDLRDFLSFSEDNGDVSIALNNVTVDKGYHSRENGPKSILDEEKFPDNVPELPSLDELIAADKKISKLLEEEDN